MISPLRFAGYRLTDVSVVQRRDEAGSGDGHQYLQRVKAAAEPFDDRIDALAESVRLDYGSRYDATPRGAFAPVDFIRVMFPYLSGGETRFFDVTVDQKPMEEFLPEKRDSMGRAVRQAFEAQRTDLWERATVLAEAAEKAIGRDNIRL